MTNKYKKKTYLTRRDFHDLTRKSDTRYHIQYVFVLFFFLYHILHDDHSYGVLFTVVTGLQ